MQCPHCSFENERTSTYCERCGSLLQNVEQDEVVGQPVYKAPPPPPLNGHNRPPSPPVREDSTPPVVDETSSQPPVVEEWGSRSTPFYKNPSSQTTRRMGVFSGILYFLGVLIIAFGAFVILVAFTTAPSIGVIGLILSLAIIIASVVLFVRLLHHIPHLHGWQRILWLVALTVTAFILLIFIDIVAPSKTITNFVSSGMIFFYGIAWCIIALW